MGESMSAIRSDIEALLQDGNVVVSIRLIPHCIEGADRYGQPYRQIPEADA
jgi:hypothetical protein